MENKHQSFLDENKLYNEGKAEEKLTHCQLQKQQANKKHNLHSIILLITHHYY